MPRPTARHRAHASTSSPGPIDAAGQDEIAQYLTKRSENAKASRAFAATLNRAAITAFVLDPNLSNRNQSLAWIRRTIRAAKNRDWPRLKGLLADADDPDPQPEALRNALAGDRRDPREIEPALAQFVKWCSEQAEVRPTRRGRPVKPRQRLADEMAREWRIAFGKPAPYQLSDRDPNHLRLPLFLDVLKEVLHLAEKRFLDPDEKPAPITNQALHDHAKRAVAADKRRVEQESHAY